MKKVLSIILAIVISMSTVLSLAACGGSGEKKENTAETTKAEITTDSLLGVWYRTNDIWRDSNDIDSGRQLLKGGLVKSSNKYNPEHWFTDDTWELHDGVVSIIHKYSDGGEYRLDYEVIDENTMKDVSCGAEFKKQ